MFEFANSINSSEEPSKRVNSILPADLVRVVAHRAQVPVERLTLDAFWTAVARQGGYLGRATDPPPGWQVLWAGWRQIQTLLEGVRLAAHLTP